MCSTNLLYQPSHVLSTFKKNTGWFPSLEICLDVSEKLLMYLVEIMITVGFDDSCKRKLNLFDDFFLTGGGGQKYFLDW